MAALQEAQSLGPHTRLMESVLDRDLERAEAPMTDHIGYILRVYVHTEGPGEPWSNSAILRIAQLLQAIVLSHFLHANRCPLRLNML